MVCFGAFRIQKRVRPVGIAGLPHRGGVIPELVY